MAGEKEGVMKKLFLMALMSAGLVVGISPSVLTFFVWRKDG